MSPDHRRRKRQESPPSTRQGRNSCSWQRRGSSEQERELRGLRVPLLRVWAAPGAVPGWGTLVGKPPQLLRCHTENGDIPTWWHSPKTYSRIHGNTKSSGSPTDSRLVAQSLCQLLLNHHLEPILAPDLSRKSSPLLRPGAATAPPVTAGRSLWSARTPPSMSCLTFTPLPRPPGCGRGTNPRHRAKSGPSGLGPSTAPAPSSCGRRVGFPFLGCFSSFLGLHTHTLETSGAQPGWRQAQPWAGRGCSVWGVWAGKGCSRDRKSVV